MSEGISVSRLARQRLPSCAVLLSLFVLTNRFCVCVCGKCCYIHADVCAGDTFPLEEVEHEALLDLHRCSGGGEWAVRWDVDAPAHTWHGVTTFAGHVT